MAFCYKLKLKSNLTKKLDKILNFKLKVPNKCQIFSNILFGYSKLEEENDTLENNDKYNKVHVMRMLWKRKKYQQF